jgi:DNA-binding transcriptional regulator YdaS (Cro superfamily)
MDIDTYLRSGVETAVNLAGRIGVTPAFVSHWRTGLRPIPLERCAAIEQATGGLVTRQELRPDDWHLIWPELAERAAASTEKVA